MSALPAEARKLRPTERPHGGLALEQCAGAVLSGSIVDWGHDAEDFFELIVFLYVGAAVRLERLKNREVERFGHVSPELLKWASEYDTVPRKERSLAMHKEWVGQRKCRVVHLLGDMSVEERVSRVLEHAKH